MKAARAVGAVLAVTMAGCARTEPLLPERLEGLTLDTLHSIEPRAGAPWAAMTGIWDAALDADGRLAILDLGGPAVHVFDRTGAHLGSVDQAGLEPGRIDDPSGLAWDGPGALLVWDPGAGWISRFRTRGGSLDFVDRHRAFAFGETGFCALDGRRFLSYWQDGLIVHEVGPDGVLRSFGDAPAVAGAEALGAALREIAVEELTPSALLCTAAGVLDVGFTQAVVRLHDPDGAPRWERTLEDLRPIVVHTPDGVGLGRAFDEERGSHVLRSVVPWGASMALIQHELRMHEGAADAAAPVVESRLVRLGDGAEVARRRALPIALAAPGRRLVLVDPGPTPRVTVVELRPEE